jgi:L-threonylcarbamoyladenylate synthase
MLENNIWNNENLIKVFKEDGVVVMPTDTIYGIVGRAQSESVVNRIYKIRNRNIDKPCIILIGDISELEKFSINLTEEQKNKLHEYWPALSEVEGFRPVSIVLDCPLEKFAYLHRGTNTLAFRLPAQKELQHLLLKVGPLIAPSANTEKFPESETIEDAKNYFGDKVDLYIDGGEITSQASKLIKLHKDGSVSILRE